MKRKLVCITAFLTLLLALTTSVTTNVHAATVSTPSSSTDLKACAVIDVQLHGSQDPTMTCAQKQKVVNGKITPAGIVQGGCNAGTLQLFGDANYSGGPLDSGNILCFSGYGSTNMTSYPYSYPFQSVPESWNDELSSFKTGNACVAFYWNTNDGGSSFSEGPYVNVSYIGDTWNDQVSSFYRYAC
jgi:hypothetical protein